MPGVRKTHFVDAMVRARDLVGLGQSIGGMTHGRVDCSDLYRSSVVQAIAAMDSYIHGVILDRGVAIVLGRLHVPGKSAQSGLGFNAVSEILTASTPAEQELRARTHLVELLTRETYQKPDDIGKALSMVGIKSVWKSAFSVNPEGAKLAISVIVNRRNKIVHGCDVDPLNPQAVTALSDSDALYSIEVVETTVLAIDAVI
jgi:hypothetical protein